MRVLLANYRYFVSGGPERYMFNVTDALAARGHEIIPFSIRYSRNRPTPYADYFVPPLAGENEVLFREQRRTPTAIIRTISRLFYAGDVERAIGRLTAETQPQIAYVLHYLRKLSPSLLVGLKKAGLPIVVRLSDFTMLCPQAHFLRGSNSCELCLHGSLLPSVRNRCVQGGLVPSGLNALATVYHRLRRYFDLIDVFVTPTRFMYDKMVEAGFPERRLRCIPTFVDGRAFHSGNAETREPMIVYSGRLVPMKGVHVLVDAAARLRQDRPDLDFHVKVAGTGSPVYLAQLKRQVDEAKLGSRVEFLGELEVQNLATLLRASLVSVVPSLWYENLPNSALESLASGTPVVASNLGSLPECIQPDRTGLLFQTGNAGDLAEKLGYCLDRPEQLAQMSETSHRVAADLYSPQRHVEALEDLLTGLANARPKIR